MSMRLILNEFNSKFGVFNAAKCRFHSFFSAYLLGMVVSQNKGISHAAKDIMASNPMPRSVHSTG